MREATTTTTSASSSSSSKSQVRPASLPALLSTVLLLLACCAREGHGQLQPRQEYQRQRHPRNTINLEHGGAPRLRTRSQAHLQEWAARERLRIKGKYGEIVTGSSSLRTGSSNDEASGSSTTRLEPLKKAKRQNTSSGRSRTASATHTDDVDWSSWLVGTGFPSPSSTSTGGRTTHSSGGNGGRTNLTNYQTDLEYYAPIHVGTPAQTFNVILDTGSADFWLVDNNCTSIECTEVRTFAANISSSSATTSTDFTIRYGAGSASGQLWNDTIALAGRELPNQTVALCDEVSQSLLAGNASGIMGLGFPSLAVTRQTPYWMNLMQSNDTDLDFEGFSFYLTRFINSTNAASSEFGGYFTLGTLANESYTGEIQYIDIPEGSESYWVIPMAAISLNGTNITGLGAPNVAIDTGTTLIGGPSAVVETFYESIGGAYALDQEYEGYYTYPCDTEVDIAFTFGNITYPMSSDDLNLGLFNAATNQCLGAFFDLTLSSGSAAVISWVIGGAFLKNVYSIYRYSPGPSVGFAQLSPSFIAATDNQNGSSPVNATSTAVVSGFFGGPTIPVNGSTITGSPLNPFSTSTAPPLAPAGNDIATADVGSAARSTALSSISQPVIYILSSLFYLSIWTLDIL